LFDDSLTSHKVAGGPCPIRVLAVEDEFLLSVALAEDLRAAGYLVVGPFTTLSDALDAARREPFDLAVLDINIRGAMIYPLADELFARGIPFVFLTGYGRADLPARFAAIPRISKPYEARALLDELDRCANAAGAHDRARAE
jgi:DNA-binding response OmpR family regulator